MKALSIKILLVTLVSAVADTPENFPPSRYIDLYRNSALTDKPIVEEPLKEDPKLDEWTLVGVRKYEGRFEVTILNTKDRTNRLVIPSAKATEEGFALKEVKYEPFLKSEVTLQKGSSTGVVTFDPKYLVLKAVAAPVQQNRPSPTQVAAKPSGNTKENVPTPPTPGKTPPVPGSSPTTTNTKVPVPQTTSTSARPTARPTTSSSRTSSGRTRYVPRPRK
jgi:hypothetical protein